MWGILPDRRCAALAGAAIFLVLTGGDALAQSRPSAATPPSAEELNPVARVPEPKASTGRGDLLGPPSPGPCPLRDSKRTFKFNGVTFTGANSLTGADLAPAYAGLIGQDIPVSSLCDIRDRVSDILFDHDLFATVELPQQKVVDGHVTFQVIEGYIARVRVLGDDSAAQAKVEDYIQRLSGMKPFNLRKAQRYLFLAQDVPGVSISATLKRGGPEPGAVELDITIVSRRPWDVLANVQNYGSRSIGPFGSLVRVDLNSFTDMGERTTLVGYQTIDVKEQHVLQAIEEIRLGSDGLLGRTSFSLGETHPGGALQPLALSALSYVTEVALAYPLVRQREVNLNLTGGVQIIDQRVTSAGSLLSQDRLRVLYGRLEADRSFHDDVNLDLGGTLELRQGAIFWGGSREGDALLSRDGGHPGAFVLRGETHAALGQFDSGQVGKFLSGFSENLDIQGQYSAAPLLSYEQMAIGNLTIGRGYDPAAVNGDSGVAGSAEIHWAPYWMLFPPEWKLNLSPFGFYDVAQVWNHDAENRRLRSIGGGLSTIFSNNLRLDTLYAHPLDPVSSTAARPPGDRVLVNLTVGY